MRRQCTVLLIAALTGGCINLSSNSLKLFVDEHCVLRKKDAWQLVGPYRMKEVASPNAILVEKDGNELRVVLRGCEGTNQRDLDFRARKLLGTMWPEDVYLHKDSIVRIGDDVIKAVVYDPANQVFIGKDGRGKLLYDTQTYTVKQLKLLLYGYCLLDRSDTDYPLFPVFLEAEQLAKKHRQGYWKTHAE